VGDPGPSGLPADLRPRVLAAAQEAHRQGLLTMTSGNFSARDPETGRIAITPTGRPYPTMGAADICVLDADGSVVAAPSRPSSESELHRGVYAARADVHGIAHVHSVHANAVGALGLAVPPIVGTLWRYVGGELKTAPFRESGTAEYAAHALRVMGDQRAVIMANHGLLAIGATVEEALEVAAYAEEGARVYLLARALGEPSRHPRPRPGSMYAPRWWPTS
jgi:L-ribulose-5-phosphate 4-epimerase